MLAEKARLTQLHAPPPAYIREGCFRFMDLPAELRTHIYSFLLPHQMDISFRVRPPIDRHATWITIAKPRSSKKKIDATEKDEEAAVMMGGSPRKRSHYSEVMHVQSPGWLKVETQVLRVSKAVGSEAKAVFYGTNAYHFFITDNVHRPISLQSKHIFGPFSLDLTNRLPILRNLRIIHLDVIIHEDTLWTTNRHFSRLEYFVSILKQHADDADRRSLLQELTVHMHDSPFTHILGNWNYRAEPLVDVEDYMFGLEPLAQLTGVKSVKIEGVPAWFADCLQIAIMGKGGEVKECDWPNIRFKKPPSKVGRRWEWKEKSVRKWWQPRLNWKEFAERNGVVCPEDVEKYLDGARLNPC